MRERVAGFAYLQLTYLQNLFDVANSLQILLQPKMHSNPPYFAANRLIESMYFRIRTAIRVINRIMAVLYS